MMRAAKVTSSNLRVTQKVLSNPAQRCC